MVCQLLMINKIYILVVLMNIKNISFSMYIILEDKGEDGDENVFGVFK